MYAAGVTGYRGGAPKEIVGNVVSTAPDVRMAPVLSSTGATFVRERDFEASPLFMVNTTLADNIGDDIGVDDLRGEKSYGRVKPAIAIHTSCADIRISRRVGSRSNPPSDVVESAERITQQSPIKTTHSKLRRSMMETAVCRTSYRLLSKLH